jgi:hypothetical protein
MATYTLVSAIVFTGLTLIWNKSNGLNLLLKLAFAGMAIAGYIQYFGK